MSSVLHSFYYYEMEQDRLEAAIAAAPAWTKIGLTMPSERMRERATAELAACILDSIDQPLPVIDRNQLPLPL